MLAATPRLLLGLCLASATASAADTRFATDKPVINFRLPTFTPEGHRAWLVRGSEARFNGEDRIDIKDLTLSIFTGEADGKLDTLILSPTAELRPGESLASGPGAIRVISDQFEATGTGWKYAHKDKRISIAKNVRVVFHAEFKDLLK